MKNRKTLVIVTVITIFALVAGTYLVVRHTARSRPVENEERTAVQTPEERPSGDIAKEKIVKSEEENNPETDKNGKRVVTPVVTYSDRTVINAYVPGVFEDGGTCTATLSDGTNTLTSQSVGFTNVSYTQCAPINLESTAVSPGSNWSFSIKYSSANAEGVSENQILETR